MEPVPLPPAPMIFEEAPSTSAVRIAPTPIPIAPLLTEIRPNFSLQFDYSPGQFRPGGGDWEPDVDHVFQRSEVDQQETDAFWHRRAAIVHARARSESDRDERLPAP